MIRRGTETQTKMWKFLGVRFDVKLAWNEDLHETVSKCRKIVNVMRRLTGSEWGARRSAVNNIHTALIGSVLDYRSAAHDSAAIAWLKKLHVLQTQAFRLCCAAFICSSDWNQTQTVNDEALGESSRAFRRPSSNSDGAGKELNRRGEKRHGSESLLFVETGFEREEILKEKQEKWGERRQAAKRKISEQDSGLSTASFIKHSNQ